MLSRLRPFLPAFVLVLVVVAVAVAIPMGVLAATATAEAPVGLVKKRAKPKLKRHVKRARHKPVLSMGERAAKYALGAVGVPYRWGGTSMSGFDCSGLVYWAYRRLGVTVPHNSYALWSAGRHITRGHAKPGDVLVFSGLGHVGMYIGRGKMVHAPQSGRNVEIVTLSRSRYGSRVVGVRRFTRQ
jgi:cell wall-associated NlpC family hydrolase